MVPLHQPIAQLMITHPLGPTHKLQAIICKLRLNLEFSNPITLLKASLKLKILCLLLRLLNLDVSLKLYHGTQKLVDCRWVFKNKFKADGSLLKPKARLVAKGFQQVPSIGYGETFSSVVKPTTIRVILTIAITFNWEIRQLDVNNAFLNEYLQDVYMRQPEGSCDLR